MPYTAKKAELIKEIADKMGVYNYVADSFLDALKEVVLEHLLNGENVVLHDFLKFSVNKKYNYNYYDPHSDTKRIIPETKHIVVKASRGMNKQINKYS